MTQRGGSGQWPVCAGLGVVGGDGLTAPIAPFKLVRHILRLHKPAVLGRVRPRSCSRPIKLLLGAGAAEPGPAGSTQVLLRLAPPRRRPAEVGRIAKPLLLLVEVARAAKPTWGSAERAPRPQEGALGPAEPILRASEALCGETGLPGPWASVSIALRPPSKPLSVLKSLILNVRHVCALVAL